MMADMMSMMTPSAPAAAAKKNAVKKAVSYTHLTLPTTSRV